MRKLTWRAVRRHYPVGTQRKHLRNVRDLNVDELSQWFRIYMRSCGLIIDPTDDVRLVSCTPDGAVFELYPQKATRVLDITRVSPPEFHLLTMFCRVNIFKLKI